MWFCMYFAQEGWADLIRVKQLNNKEFLINAELIKLVEATPDTIITLINNEKYVVAESMDEIIEKVVEYRRRVNAPLRL